MMLRIRLPFPDRRLNPNVRLHWAQVSSARREARDEGFYAANQAHGRQNIFSEAKPLSLRIAIYPPDNRRRDVDNIITALKSYQDGIFSYIGLDDSQIKRPEPIMRRSCPDGKIYYILYQK